MKAPKTLLRLTTSGLIGISLIIIIFILSENQIHRNNAFVRRYPHHPIIKKYDLPLKYNSYYIAGYENNQLYLGNTTAPLHLLEVNLKTKDTQHLRITLDRMDLPFRSITVKFHPPYFFITDGFVPCIFRGNIGDWHASLWMKNKTYFTRAIPIDSNKLYIKAISSKTNEATLGVLEKQDGFNVLLDPDLLEKQIDGMFDVDGTMVVSKDKENLGYVYFYRNQFMIMDPDLKLINREETIDTVRVAKIQLSQANTHGEVKMTTPPLEINKTAALYKNLMLIHSNRLGKYEEKTMLKQAAIIDVYNWKKRTYEFSFYLYTIGQKKVRAFNIYNNHLVALIGDVLSVYQLKPSHFQ